MERPPPVVRTPPGGGEGGGGGVNVRLRWGTVHRLLGHTEWTGCLYGCDGGSEEACQDKSALQGQWVGAGKALCMDAAVDHGHTSRAAVRLRVEELCAIVMHG